MLLPKTAVKMKPLWKKVKKNKGFIKKNKASWKWRSQRSSESFKLSSGSWLLFTLDPDLGSRRPMLAWEVSSLNSSIDRSLFFMCSWEAFLNRLSGYPETVFSTSSLWKSFLSILTNADWWFSKEKYVPHNDIMYSQRKKFSVLTTPCLSFLAAHNMSCHVKFWKPSVAQVLLMRFFERNFVFRRYRLRSGISFFHKPREMDSFDL